MPTLALKVFLHSAIAKEKGEEIAEGYERKQVTFEEEMEGHPEEGESGIGEKIYGD